LVKAFSRAADKSRNFERRSNSSSENIKEDLYSAFAKLGKLKVLSIEMDPVEIRLIREIFFKGGIAAAF